MTDAVLAAALFAVDPAGTGGVSLAARAGPVRDAWLTLLRGLLPAAAPVRRVPLHVTDDRLLGGLDLAATLRAGRPVAQRGLLAEADGGVVVLAMAERLPNATAARLASALDAGEVVLERDGLAQRAPARLGVVALDEGMPGEERPPAALLDRLAFRVDLDGVRAADFSEARAAEVAAARALLPAVRVRGAIIEAFCAAALALGVPSLRAPLLAVRVARAAAALAGRRMVSAEDAALAARLVLAPRATTLPAPETPEERKGDETHSAVTAQRAWRTPTPRASKRWATSCWRRPRRRYRLASCRSCGSVMRRGRGAAPDEPGRASWAHGTGGRPARAGASRGPGRG